MAALLCCMLIYADSVKRQHRSMIEIFKHFVLHLQDRCVFHPQLFVENPLIIEAMLQNHLFLHIQSISVVFESQLCYYLSLLSKIRTGNSTLPFL